MIVKSVITKKTKDRPRSLTNKEFAQSLRPKALAIYENCQQLFCLIGKTFFN